jgi:hypothetical protein
MKRLICLCALIPLLAYAAARDDYARQWPLTLHGDSAGAYRIALDREVYRSAQLSSLRDVDVLNAEGAPVPAALFAAEQPLAQSPPRQVELPWFPLPAGPAAHARDSAVLIERAPDGSVRRVETRLSAAGQQAAPTDAWLVDASHVHERIVALELDWPATSGTLDSAYRVEGSDDLRDWRVLQPRVQLLDLVRAGQRLEQRRIPLDGAAKYLRLRPDGAGIAPALTGVRAELAPAATALAWNWESLPGRTIVDHGNTAYTFDLDGRFPIERADVALPGNSASEWTLQSRDREDAPWQTRAGPWVAYRVGTAPADRSAAQALGGVIRDRHWRLSSRTPVNGIPTLRLGYRPEVMVFVAQGSGPFALVAGSARAVRAQAPVPTLVEALRMQHGSRWQPADATLGSPAILAGDAAFAPAPAPARRDWKAWLLWGILVGGTLVVAGFAFSLLRKPAVS